MSTFVSILCVVAIMVGGALVILGSRQKGGRIVALAIFLAILWPFGAGSVSRLIDDVRLGRGWLSLALLFVLVALFAVAWGRFKKRSAGGRNKATEPPTSLKRRVDGDQA